MKPEINTETAETVQTGGDQAVVQERLVSLLSDVKWAMDNFGSLHTNRQIPRRKLETAIKRGYVESIGMAQPCDADGSMLWNRREREGWILTDAGREFLQANA